MQGSSINIGYGFTKALGSEGQAVVFRSVGAVEQGAISFETELNKPESTKGAKALDLRDRGLFVDFNGERWALGRAAYEHGRMQVQDMSRARLEEPAYRLLYAASLAATIRHSADVAVVASLPLRWYNGDREKARQILSGEFRIKYRGVNRTYSIAPKNCHIVPEGFGALCSKVLTPSGTVADPALAKARVGIVDVGTRTVGFLLVDNLRVIPTESDMTEDLGMFQVWKMLQETISMQYGREFNYREVDEIVHQRGFDDAGQWVDLTDEIDRACQALANGISAQINGLWDSGRSVRYIFPTGGTSQFVKMFLPYRNMLPTQNGDLKHAFFDNALGGMNFAIARGIIQ